MKKVLYFFGVIGTVMFISTGAFAQTGKISGQVTDAASGDPLPGVNVVIEGTTQGATTDADGFYTILNVSPGTHVLRASFVGYASQVMEGVEVDIDLTTTVDFELQEEAVGLDEVVVQSQQPVVRPDISANVANVDMGDVENLPVTSVEDVITLQAGFQGLTVRGTGPDELAMNVDGASMRNPRDNTPFTNISYTSVDEVQVQTGGFNAEYGNLRSGLINVTTKEGPRDHYTADVIARYTPPMQKYFGPQPNAGINGEVPPEEMAYWIRPYIDSDVAYVGTHSDESPWDRYKQRQYPRFEGFNAVAQRSLEDPEMGDLTPEQAQEAFQWYHRKSFEATTPDYEVDGSIGGPVPGISDPLGDLRFFASYRQTQTAYAIPLYRDAYQDQMGQLKLTSNITNTLKLQVQGMYGHQSGMNASTSGFGDIHSSGTSVVYGAETTQYSVGLFSNQLWSKTDIRRRNYSAKLTHTLGPRTFYNLRVQRNNVEYETGPGRQRDYSTINTIGGMDLDEAPFGYHNTTRIYSPTGMRIGGRWGLGRDSSRVSLWIAGGDVTSQFNRYNQVKTGFELYYTDYNAAHEVYQPVMPSVANPDYYWHRQTTQGAAYLQDKLEFQGMIANLGVRLDYFQPRGQWYDYSIYDDAFADNAIDEVPMEQIDPQFALSPRLGVSFPVTSNSKIYFNYGHFQNIQQTRDLFVVRESLQNSRIDQIGNPELPLARTVSYELGYDQNIFDQYLFRVAGYYKSNMDQPRAVQFHGQGGRVNYSKLYPLNYGDIRGFELTLRKNRGQWLRGFVNYTYMVEKSGNFGFDNIYENSAAMRQAIFEYRDHYQFTPVPEPYAKFNIEFLTPGDFGPELGNFRPIGNWRLSVLGNWQSGDTFTYDAQSPIDVQDNVTWVDYYNLDARLAKNFETSLGSAQLFVDVSNALNLKRMSRSAAFNGEHDFDYYMRSLHLPADAYEGAEEPYLWPYGDDRPGVYRSRDVEFVPIETVRELPDEGYSRTQGHYGPLYYVKADQKYYIWDANDGSFAEPDAEKVDQVLEDKAYIDMPNSQYFSFLNPRQVLFGIRVTL